MGGAVFTILIVIIVMVAIASKAGVAGYDALVANGVPARGILLSVSKLATKAPGSTLRRRFEQRRVTIEVEIPGAEPYEITTSPYIPSNLARDILPGATVELRVDKRKPGSIAIVGPGAGFAVATLNAAPPPDQTIARGS